MIVYKYGCMPPVEALNVVRTQMRLGHEYYNNLVEHEREVRSKAVAAANEIVGEYSDDMNKRMKQEWGQSRKMHLPTKDERNLARRTLRGKAVESGLWYGTYLLIERSFDQACKGSLNPQRPRFRSWHDAPRQCGTQVHKDKRLDMYLRMEGDGKYQVARVRVASLNREPVWCAIPVKVHRPMVGTIKWVEIKLRMSADREVWSLHVTTDHEREYKRGPSGSVCSVDLGWRVCRDGMKVAHVVDGTGSSVPVSMPERVWRKKLRADAVTSERDRLRNELVDERAAELKDLGVHFPVRSSRAIVRALSGVDPVPSWAADWIAADRKLWRVSCDIRKSLENWRRDAYNVLAHHLSSRYETVVVEDCDWRQLRKSASGDGAGREARRNARAASAAPGELRAALVQRGVVEVAKAAYTSRTCSQCGHVNQADCSDILKCERCGDERDRDERACINLLKAHRDGETNPAKRATARKVVSRFAKSHVSTEAHLREECDAKSKEE